MTFTSRHEAGLELAKALRNYRGTDTVVVALPRGGVVVGAVVAKFLRAPLGVQLVSRIGHPAYPEYAIGAVTPDCEPVFRQEEIQNINKEWLEEAITSARTVMKMRRELYADESFHMPSLSGRTAILIDDGMATGLTMEAALQAVKQHYPARIVVAVPVASNESVSVMKGYADEVIVLDDPAAFRLAVGSHYQSFPEVTDEQVRLILRSTHEFVTEAELSLNEEFQPVQGAL